MTYEGVFDPLTDVPADTALCVGLDGESAIYSFDQEVGAEAEDVVDPELTDRLSRLTPAQEAIVLQYLPSVKNIAHRIVREWNDLDDAIGDGCRALVIAATKYDPRCQNPLATNGSSYFKDCIRGGILKGMRTMRGRSANGGVENNKPGILTGTARSLDAPVSDGENHQLLGDTVISPAQHSELDVASLGEDLRRALEAISPRDRAIFLRCVVDDQTHSVVGEEFNISKVQVGRIREQVSQHVREVLADYKD